MGWQSYILFYTNDKRKKYILDLITKHNFATDEMWQRNEVGEEIIAVIDFKLSDSIPKQYQHYQGAILCGNGGGRNCTFNWFSRFRVRCIPYESKCERWFVFQQDAEPKKLIHYYTYWRFDESGTMIELCDKLSYKQY